MILRLQYFLIMAAIPTILLGNVPENSFSLCRPEVPDSLNGIEIQFEVKLLKSHRLDNPVHIYCLCADIVNQNYRPERILVRYQCQGIQKSHEIEIGSKQQKIILVDKCLMTEVNPESLHEYYSLVGLD
jgi:hypothetical protein